jgi:DnaJ-class molecular chaperone
MSLKDALKSAPIRLITLDNRCINLNIDQNITPQAVHQIIGEGMPLPKEISGIVALSQMPKGNLYVKFDIAFP